MRSFQSIGTATVVCLAFAASGCHEHSRQSLATAQGVEIKATGEQLDIYFGDRFSDVERALASKPADPDCPTF